MRRLKRRLLAAGPVVPAALAVTLAVALGAAWLATHRSATSCALLYDRASRLACRAERGLDEAGDMAEIKAALAQTSDPDERDLLVLRLVMDDPRRGAWACEQVTTPKMAAWCQELKGRPHLAPLDGRSP